MNILFFFFQARTRPRCRRGPRRTGSSRRWRFSASRWRSSWRRASCASPAPGTPGCEKVKKRTIERKRETLRNWHWHLFLFRWCQQMRFVALAFLPSPPEANLKRKKGFLSLGSEMWLSHKYFCIPRVRCFSSFSPNLILRMRHESLLFSEPYYFSLSLSFTLFATNAKGPKQLFHSFFPFVLARVIRPLS